MTKAVPTEQATEVTDDLSRLAIEDIKPVPSKKWYAANINRLIKAAEMWKKSKARNQSVAEGATDFHG